MTQFALLKNITVAVYREQVLVLGRMAIGKQLQKPLQQNMQETIHIQEVVQGGTGD